MTRIVIAPHVDDDVLGCGGVLDADTVTLYCGVDELHNGASESDRRTEAEAVRAETGGEFVWPSGRLRVNRYGDDLTELIGLFESAIVEYQPDEVCIPWPSYNQDHRAVYESALVALRPHDRLPFVPRVLIYEQPHVSHWDWAMPMARFTPTYFVPIDIGRKLHLYSLMASQVRAMRSLEHVRALAAVRGAAIGVPYAEAYLVLRWVAR